jgi:phage FluMu protein Com
MSFGSYYYPDEYEKSMDYTCGSCEKDYEDVEVTVSNRVAVIKCPACEYVNEFEVDDEYDE